MVPVSTSQEGSYMLQGLLRDAQGNLFSAVSETSLAPGIRWSRCGSTGAISGKPEEREVSRWNISFLEVQVRWISNRIATRRPAMPAVSFAPKGSDILGAYTESAPDADGNGLLDSLKISVASTWPAQMRLPLDGFLCAQNDTPICYLKSNQILSQGSNTLTLEVDGKRHLSEPH